MTLQVTTLKQLWSQVEVGLAGFFLVYFLGLDVPPPLVPILNLLSYPVLALLLVGCWQRALHAITRSLPLVGLNLLAVGSVFWSVAPEFTADESKALIRSSLFGAYLAVRFGFKGQMRLLAWLLGMGVIASLVAGLAFPAYGIHQTGEFVGAWKGVFRFKNLFASLMAISALLFLLRTLYEPRRRWLSGLMLGLSIVLLSLSRGQTAWVTFLTATSLILFYESVKWPFKSKALLITSITLAACVVLGLMAVNLEFIVVDVLGKNLEFNGRLPIWSILLEQGSQRPWLGHGYAAFWTSDAANYLLNHSWAFGTRRAGIRFNAHSGYLDLFLQLGWVGLSLFLISFVGVLGRTVYLFLRTKQLETLWILQFLVFMGLINVSDSLSIGSGGGLWSLYVAFVALTSVQCARLQHQDELPPVSRTIGAEVLLR
jgi:O-antigen ligase